MRFIKFIGLKYFVLNIINEENRDIAPWKLLSESSNYIHVTSGSKSDFQIIEIKCE